MQTVELFLKKSNAQRCCVGRMKMRWPKSDVDTCSFNPVLGILGNNIWRCIKTLKKAISSCGKTPCVRNSVYLSDLVFEAFDRCSGSYYFRRASSHALFASANQCF